MYNIHDNTEDKMKQDPGHYETIPAYYGDPMSQSYRQPEGIYSL